jgi:uncharacterized protein YbjQ (UPF0145 family)
MSNIFSAKYVPLTANAIFTTPEVAGRTIEQSFGLIAILGENASVTSSSLPQLMEAALAKATELGANAIVGAHFQSVMGAMFLYGTAVRLSQ